MGKYNSNQPVTEQVRHLISLLITERDEDRLKFQHLLSSNSLQQKREAGITWYPVEIKESGYGTGDYPFLVVECHNMKDKSHRFSGGKPVTVFTTQTDAEDMPINATIHFVTGNVMKLIFQRNELPEWIHGGRIGVDLAFDEKSYSEMNSALNQLLKADNNRVAQFLEIVYGERIPEFEENIQSVKIPELNDSQNAAVNAMVATKDIMIIHGPPGTGKTTTLVAGIAEISKQGERTLVCAPSNTAADLLTEKLALAGLNVIRLGNLSRIDDAVLSHTPEGIMAALPIMKEIKRIRKQSGELRRMALKYKRNFGRAEREQRNLLIDEAKKLSQQAYKMEEDALQDALRSAHAIVTTLVGATNRLIGHKTFKTLVIDEAAQALEPACWIPMLRAERVILAGDPFQLPPTVKSDLAKRNGLSQTLIEKCLKKFSRVFLLDTQYRMNAEIMAFPNSYFYQGKLQAHPSVASHSLPIPEGLAFEFIDTAGCSFDELINPDSQSFYNPGEYSILAKHLEELMLSLPVDFIPSIGVIAPYSAQTKFMTAEILENDFFQNHAARLTINTIDSFQGQERDIIYISLVRSNSQGQIGFLSDYRRMNVAITRARKKLVIVGDSATIGNDPFYNLLIEYAQSSEAYRSAWELI